MEYGHRYAQDFIACIADVNFIMTEREERDHK